MKVSVVIPCYNERNIVAEIVSAVRTAPLPDIEIIVVDDGSTDGSRTILKRNVEHIADRVIYHGVNRGKGAALRSGFAAATGESFSSRMPTSNTTRRNIRACSSQF